MEKSTGKTKLEIGDRIESISSLNTRFVYKVTRFTKTFAEATMEGNGNENIKLKFKIELWDGQPSVKKREKWSTTRYKLL